MVWQSLGDDSLFEELPPIKERISLDQIFRETAQRAIEEPVPPKEVIEIDLPKRKGHEKKIVMNRDHKRAIHVLLKQKVPIPRIAKKYNVTKVAVRLHKRGDCTCSKRGLID